MKGLFLIGILLVSRLIMGQTIICPNEELELILPDGYRGDIQWQYQLEESEWIDIEGATTNNFIYSPQDDNVKIRAKVTQEDCEPDYSEYNNFKVSDQPAVISLGSSPYFILDTLDIHFQNIQDVQLIYDNDTIDSDQVLERIILTNIENEVSIIGQTKDGCQFQELITTSVLPFYRANNNLLFPFSHEIILDDTRIHEGVITLSKIDNAEALLNRTLYLPQPIDLFLHIVDVVGTNNGTDLFFTPNTILDAIDDGDTISYELSDLSLISSTSSSSSSRTSSNEIGINLTQGIDVIFDELRVSGQQLVTKSESTIFAIGPSDFRGRGKIIINRVGELDIKNLFKSSDQVSNSTTDLSFKIGGFEIVKSSGLDDNELVLPVGLVGPVTINAVIGIDVNYLKANLQGSAEIPFDFGVKLNKSESEIYYKGDAYTSTNYEVGSYNFDMKLENPEGEMQFESGMSIKVGFWPTISGTKVGPKVTVGPTSDFTFAAKLSDMLPSAAWKINGGLAAELSPLIIEWGEKKYEFFPMSIGTWDILNFQDPSAIKFDKSYIRLPNSETEFSYNLLNSNGDNSRWNNFPITLNVPNESDDLINNEKSVTLNKDQSGNISLAWTLSETTQYVLEANVEVPNGFDIEDSPSHLFACPSKLSIDQTLSKIIDLGDSYNLRILEDFPELVQVQWQYSLGNNEWQDIVLANTNNFIYYPEGSQFVRVKFSHSDCYPLSTPLISEEIFITVCRPDITLNHLNTVGVISGENLELKVINDIFISNDNLLWGKVDENGNWSQISDNAVGNGYTLESITEPVVVQALYLGGDCEDVYSDELQITIKCRPEITIDHSNNIGLNSGESLALNVVESISPDDENLLWGKVDENGNWLQISDNAVGNGYTLENITEPIIIQALFKQDNCNDLYSEKLIIEVCYDQLSITENWSNPIGYNSNLSLSVNELLQDYSSLIWEWNSLSDSDEEWVKIGNNNNFITPPIQNDMIIRGRYESASCQDIISNTLRVEVGIEGDTIQAVKDIFVNHPNWSMICPDINSPISFELIGFQASQSVSFRYYPNKELAPNIYYDHIFVWNNNILSLTHRADNGFAFVFQILEFTDTYLRLTTQYANGAPCFIERIYTRN